MTIRVACPDCSTILNAPDSATGKQAICPKCQSRMILPDADEIDRPRKKAIARVADVDDDEVEDERPRKKKRKAPKRRKSPVALWVAGGIGLAAVIVVVMILILRGGGTSSAARKHYPNLTKNDMDKVQSANPASEADVVRIMGEPSGRRARRMNLSTGPIDEVYLYYLSSEQGHGFQVFFHDGKFWLCNWFE